MAIKLELEDNVIEYLRGNTYAGTGVRFALCTLLKDKKVKALTDFIGCRDAFLSYMADHFNKPETDKLEGLSTRKTAVLVQVSHGKPQHKDPYPWCKGTYASWLKSGVGSGVKIINHFEKEYKWVLSKAHDVETDEDLNICVRLVQGSRWWISSPYTFSLFLLLIRSACHHENIYKLGKSKKLTTNKIIKEFKKLDDDYLYKKEDIWKWIVLLKYRRELFKGCTTVDNYKDANRFGFDGICHLTDNNVRNEDLKQRFGKICAEHKDLCI